ncbi:MAG: hypothetical protein JSR46_02085 [Verrucomicrobia bacterium]|nr:hypothetical protein [Verrucomicrobiota bacterium]
MPSITKVAAQLNQLCELVGTVKRTDMIKVDDAKEIHFSRSDMTAFDEMIEFAKGKLALFFPCLAPHLKTEAVFGVPSGGLVGYLSHIVGKARFERILARAGLDLSYRMSNALSGIEIHQILVHAAEVYEADVQELLDQIASDSKQVIFLSESETEELRRDFHDVRALDDCTNDHLECLFSLLTPFGSVSRLFSRALQDMAADVALTGAASVVTKGKVDILDAATVGISSQLIKERVEIYEKMNSEPRSYEKWMMLLAKKLIYYQLPEKVVLRNGHGGFCAVHEKVSEAGACKFFLRQIGESHELNNVVAYRGTIPDVHTLLEDFRSEFGSRGPQATYQRTFELLSSLKERFIRKEDEKVDCIGTSLGACHVMRDAVLMKDKFARIDPIVGPGPDVDSMQLYADMVNASEGVKPKIVHWWEADDVSQYFGGVHLGYNCNPEKADVTINILEELKGDEPQEESLQDAVERIVQKTKFPTSTFRMVALAKGTEMMLRSLDGPHRRNTLEFPHRIHRISNQEHPELVNKFLGHHSDVCDPEWENMRQITVLENIPFVEKTEFAKYAQEIKGRV